MTAVKAYFDGRVFIPTELVRAKMNQAAIITLLDEEIKEDKPHLEFIGVLSQEGFDEINEALLDTQTVDSDEW